jgi:DNA-binding response OmpR family regulator
MSALERFKPHLVTLGLMMPKMNGFKLYDQLKKIDDNITVSGQTQ